jgi:hypothetical protein
VRVRGAGLTDRIFANLNPNVACVDGAMIG